MLTPCGVVDGITSKRGRRWRGCLLPWLRLQMVEYNGHPLQCSQPELVFTLKQSWLVSQCSRNMLQLEHGTAAPSDFRAQLGIAVNRTWGCA